MKRTVWDRATAPPGATPSSRRSRKHPTTSGPWRRRRQPGPASTPTILEIGQRDALDDLDRILADNDDIYISLPSAAWLIYRELRRHKVLVSLDGHGADELMGAYLR